MRLNKPELIKTTPDYKPEVIKLTVPMPENLTNRGSGRSHWRTIHREKVAYWDFLDSIQRLGNWHAQRAPIAYRIPSPPQPLANASIRSTMYLGNPMDDVNAMARHKVIEDWLKTRGYIKDDRKKCLTWEGFPEQIIKRDGNYRVEITLTPIVK